MKQYKLPTNNCSERNDEQTVQAACQSPDWVW